MQGVAITRSPRCGVQSLPAHDEVEVGGMSKHEHGDEQKCPDSMSAIRAIPWVVLS